MARMEDIGSYIKILPGAVQKATLLSSDTGNLDAINGVDQDLLDYKKFHSLKVGIAAYIYFDTSGTTFMGNCNLQDRASTSGAGSTWANFGTTGQTFSVVNATTSTKSSGFYSWELTFGKSIRTIRRHIRVHTEGNDTKGWFGGVTASGHIFHFASVIILGGAQSAPATSTSVSE